MHVHHTTLTRQTGVGPTACRCAYTLHMNEISPGSDLNTMCSRNGQHAVSCSACGPPEFALHCYRIKLLNAEFSKVHT
jgi:hypothetical protein